MSETTAVYNISNITQLDPRAIVNKPQPNLDFYSVAFYSEIEGRKFLSYDERGKGSYDKDIAKAFWCPRIVALDIISKLPPPADGFYQPMWVGEFYTDGRSGVRLKQDLCAENNRYYLTTRAKKLLQRFASIVDLSIDDLIDDLSDGLFPEFQTFASGYFNSKDNAENATLECIILKEWLRR